MMTSICTDGKCRELVFILNDYVMRTLTVRKNENQIRLQFEMLNETLKNNLINTFGVLGRCPLVQATPEIS